ncbi:FecCD family ABC transporter permease [Nocardiopsis suaedae]|uniref:Iron ABC transporter permease n=1 Tax=Nocardiopsis suaedae TaxID=3018444 RepID=A0ABT4TPZ9_9ACTN|nr:iron ABC transporter permease [Nocardiopsis suaedae]MDA2806232.1 iron ABC transporter permease [Nocardiopsis suaedae]
MTPRIPFPLLLGALTAAVAAAVPLSIGVGAVPLPPQEVVRIVADRLSSSAPADSPEAYIVWELRGPRALQAVFVGAGLAVAGAVVQALVRNPVADPHLLGLSSGASTGAVLAMAAFGGAAAGPLVLPGAAFAGAAAAGAAVFALARAHGTAEPLRLVLVGVAVGQLLGGATSFMVLRQASGDAQQQVLFWLLGSLAGARWPLALGCAAVVTVLSAVLTARARTLDALALGAEGAAALGVRADRARAVLFGAAALLTGAVVAVAGAIGFVGLVVPNLARPLVGAGHRRVLPTAALLGALMLVAADLAARTALRPTELPIGILTAVVGVPFLVAALRGARSGVGR